MRGPIDYIAVGFTGNKFNGEILKALDAAVKNGTIAVLDLAVILKDENGDIASAELADIDDPLISQIAAAKASNAGLIDDDDVAEIGEVLANDSAAGLLIIEHLWAKPLKQAIIDTGGVLLTDGRIHPDAVEEVNAKIGE